MINYLSCSIQLPNDDLEEKKKNRGFEKIIDYRLENRLLMNAQTTSDDH